MAMRTPFLSITLHKTAFPSVNVAAIEAGVGREAELLASSHTFLAFHAHLAVQSLRMATTMSMSRLCLEFRNNITGTSRIPGFINTDPTTMALYNLPHQA
jgi:hypothetical protein